MHDDDTSGEGKIIAAKITAVKQGNAKILDELVKKDYKVLP